MRRRDQLNVKFYEIPRDIVTKLPELRAKLKTIEEKLKEWNDEVVLDVSSGGVWTGDVYVRAKDCWYAAHVTAAYHYDYPAGVYVLTWFESSAECPKVSFYYLPDDDDEDERDPWELMEAVVLWELLDVIDE